MRAARSFFYACAIEDGEKAISNLLSLKVLAELKDEDKSAIRRLSTGGRSQCRVGGVVAS
jgi:hypothetical protein